MDYGIKDIEGYEGLYAITSCGKVWSYRSNRFLTLHNCHHNYYQATLCKNGTKKQFLVHRLVAQAYLPNPNNLPEVNHIDENGANNSILNLEWCTSKYNTTFSQGKEIICIETQERFPSISEAARTIGRSKKALQLCLNGETQSCAGLHWKYK